jgi:hypothetical protein
MATRLCPAVNNDRGIIAAGSYAVYKLKSEKNNGSCRVFRYFQRKQYRLKSHESHADAIEILISDMQGFNDTPILLHRVSGCVWGNGTPLARGIVTTVMRLPRLRSPGFRQTLAEQTPDHHTLESRSLVEGTN